MAEASTVGLSHYRWRTAFRTEESWHRYQTTCLHRALGLPFVTQPPLVPAPNSTKIQTAWPGRRSTHPMVARHVPMRSTPSAVTLPPVAPRSASPGAPRRARRRTSSAGTTRPRRGRGRRGWTCRSSATACCPRAVDGCGWPGMGITGKDKRKEFQGSYWQLSHRQAHGTSWSNSCVVGG